MLSESDKARWEKMRSLLNRVRYPVLTEWNSMVPEKGSGPLKKEP